MIRDRETRKRRVRSGGFTLIELMVVVIVLAILAATIIPQFKGTAHQARLSASQSVIATLKQSLTRYELDMGRYPTTEEGLQALVTDPTNGEGTWRGPYIEELIPDPWNNEYQYQSPGNEGRNYDLYSFGADGADGGEGDNKDITSWRQAEDKKQ